MDNWIITVLAILFIVIVLFCMMYIIPVFNKKQKDGIRDKSIKLVEFIFAAIGVLATCLTIISGSSKLINNNINSIIQEQNLINNRVITNQQIINNMVSINDDTSETELMRMSEVCFDNKGWSTLLEIYSSDKLMDNAVRSANLAYLYVNGLGVNQNFMIAEQYYTLAMQKGCDDAIQKKLLIYLKCNMLEEAMDLIIKYSAREEIKMLFCYLWKNKITTIIKILLKL